MHESMKRLQKVAKTDKNSDIAKDLNVGASTVTNWSNRGVSKEGALAAAAKYKTDANYILDGSLNDDKNEKALLELERIKNSSSVNVTSSSEGLIEIPLYGVYFCCGDGNGECEFEEIKGTRNFHPSFFTDNNIKPEDFKLVCAANGSLSPYINDGDVVGVHIADKEVKDGNIYAILLDNDRMFKQIFREPGGALRLHSFDANYPDRIVTNNNHESLIIVGKQIYRAG